METSHHIDKVPETLVPWVAYPLNPAKDPTEVKVVTARVRTDITTALRRA